MSVEQPNYFEKDPDALLDYGVSWQAWLPTGDTIVTGTWIVPNGLTVENTSLENSNTWSIVWLSGGSVGRTYLVINRINTNQGRADDRTIAIVVREK